jgi:hypothetical protein
MQIHCVQETTTNVSAVKVVYAIQNQIEAEDGRLYITMNSDNTAITSPAPRLSFPKPTTIRNKAYIEFIKGFHCCVCGYRPPSDPHHVSLKGHGSKGKKTHDTRTIPLCHYHHVEFHNIGRDSFASKYSLDYESTIGDLLIIYNLKMLSGGLK